MTESPGSAPTHADLAASFDTVAADYAATRPTYPPALFDALEELAGRPLAGADVLDVGAGTGIATRLLRERGARVTAVEPGAAMAAELRAALPGVPLVRGTGDALPFAARSADLVTYAQAWHWTDPARSVPEALRVLRPGGTLAMWWNVPDRSVPWAAEQEERLARRLAGYHRHGTTAEAGRTVEALGLAVRTRSTSLRWSRRTDIAGHLRMLRSHSYVAVLGDRAAPVLADERAHLLRVFPDGVMTEPYRVDLTVVHA